MNKILRNTTKHLPLNYYALFWQFVCIPKRCQLIESNEHQTNVIQNKVKLVRIVHV